MALKGKHIFLLSIHEYYANQFPAWSKIQKKKHSQNEFQIISILRKIFPEQLSCIKHSAPMAMEKRSHTECFLELQ